MKSKFVPFTLSLALFASLSLPLTLTAKEPDPALKAQAKITQEQATKTALSKVPNGVIKEGELENENGKLVWSFDITTPGSKNITEVQVDAKTGEIVSVEVETPEKQAKEAAADKKENQPKKNK